jgi:hypothetical protein
MILSAYDFVYVSEEMFEFNREVRNAVFIMPGTLVLYNSLTPVLTFINLCNLMNSIILLTHVELVLYSGFFNPGCSVVGQRGCVFVGTI